MSPREEVGPTAAATVTVRLYRGIVHRVTWVSYRSLSIDHLAIYRLFSPTDAAPPNDDRPPSCYTGHLAFSALALHPSRQPWSQSSGTIIKQLLLVTFCWRIDENGFPIDLPRKRVNTRNYYTNWCCSVDLLVSAEPQCPYIESVATPKRTINSMELYKNPVINESTRKL